MSSNDCSVRGEKCEDDESPELHMILPWVVPKSPYYVPCIEAAQVPKLLVHPKRVCPYSPSEKTENLDGRHCLYSPTTNPFSFRPDSFSHRCLVQLPIPEREDPVHPCGLTLNLTAIHLRTIKSHEVFWSHEIKVGWPLKDFAGT